MKKAFIILSLILFTLTAFSSCEKLTTINFKSYTLNYCLSNQTGTVAAKNGISRSLKQFFKNETTASTTINKHENKAIHFTDLSTQGYGKLKYFLIQKSLGKRA